MPVVYLDTSHLSILARSLVNGDPLFTRFAKAWRDGGVELAFTRAHLMELRQHADGAIRAARYALLEQLLPARSDIQTDDEPYREAILLPAKEILRALHRRGRFDVKDGSTESADAWKRHHLEILPSTWRNRAAVGTLLSFEHSDFSTITRLFQSANRISAEAEQRRPDQQYARTRLKDLPDAPMAESDIQAALQTLERSPLSDDELQSLFPFASTAAARDAVMHEMEKLRRVIRRAGEVGGKRAYQEMMGLSDDVDENETLDQLASDAMFEHYMTSAMSALRAHGDVAQYLRGHVSASDCPGYWLSRQVGLSMRIAEAKPSGSNQFDLDHVAFAPYVDVFFTDKRVAGYVNSIRRREHTIPAIREMPPAIATASSVEAIMGALFSSNQKTESSPTQQPL